ncbi:MAG: beta-lactamase family protein, partial [Parvularculaceae bacterium]|nr:beta-lactamase family protein [Parvularculaceae bacterium]
MNGFWRAVAAACAAATLCAFAKATPAAAPIPVAVDPTGDKAGDAARLAALGAYVDGLAAAHLYDRYPPAMMVAIATPSDVFLRVYGYADVDKGVRANEDTLFRIASISKTFVWVAVMQLADEGKIDLKADVNTYLKRVKVKPAFGQPVTMNDLMAHRAGFEDTFGDFIEGRGPKTFEESLARHQPKRVAPPGLRTSYSNWGTDLAAQVVADVSGMSYAEYVRTRILAPLGMNSTALHDPFSANDKQLNDPALDARIAAPHRRKDGGPASMGHDSIDPTFAAGALAVSAKDAARWMQMFLNRGAVPASEARILSTEAFTLMRRRNFDDRLEANDFAHGFMETTIADAPVFGHGGTLSGFISDMSIAPSLGIGVFVVVNGAEGGRVPDQIAAAIIERAAAFDNYATRNPAPAAKALAEKAKSLEGVYVGARHVESKFEKIFSLGGEMTIKAEKDGSVILASGGGQRRYYPLSENTYTDLRRDRIHVYRDAAGKVLRISGAAGTNTYEPVSFWKSSAAFGAASNAATLLSLLVFIGAWRRQGREVATNAAGV